MRLLLNLYSVGSIQSQSFVLRFTIMKHISQTEAMRILEECAGEYQKKKPPVMFLSGAWYDMRGISTIRKNRIVRKFSSLTRGYSPAY